MAPSSPEARAPAADRTWKDRRGLAAAVRLAAFLGPIAASVGFVAVASRAFPKPAGFWPSAAWWVTITVLATAVMTIVERGLRRILPIPALFRLSLVFPDHAPSRFKVAMRTNTLRALQRSLEAGERPEGSDSFQEAAETVVALATALSNHDRRTRGHTERVRAYSLMIGEEMKLPPEDLERLHWAGMIHDIGKLEVPRAILNKAGRPDEGEWKVLQQHPAAGERLVEPLRGWLGEWADAASQHHERIDGKGYPFGLSGDEISLSGRIVAVADAYDVMTSVRSYKSAMPPEEARAELVRCSGTQFDAKVVRAFLNVSVGRLRAVMGPLSWVAQAPALGNVPIGAAVGTAMSGIASVFVAGVVGLTGGASADPAPPPRDLAFAAAPTATPLRVVGDEDSTTTLALRWPDGAPDRLRVTEAPAGVDLSFGAGRLTVVPEPDEWGTVEGRYEACWRQACSSSTVEVVVRPVNDVPVAVDDAVAAVGGTTAEFHPLDNDTDADGQPLRIETVRSPDDVDVTSDGSSVWFTAAPLAEGRVTLSYDVVDPAGLRASASIAVDVVAGVHQPVAVDDALDLLEDAAPVAVDVTSNDTDADLPADEWSLRIVGSPARGEAAVVGQSLVYEPDADVSGPDAVVYEVCDAARLCDTATVAVTVTPVNDPPTFATSGGVRVDEDAAPTVVEWATNVSTGPADEAAQGIRFDVRADDPSLFAVEPAVSPEGFLSFQPAPNAHGRTTVTVTALDDGGRAEGGSDASAARTATITVTPVNDPVVASADAATVAEDAVGGVAIDVLANDTDVDGDALAVTAIDGSTLVGGTVTRSGGILTYTPDPDHHGVETLTYTVADGNGSTATASVTVTVTPVNDSVVATDDAASIAEDAPGGVTVDVLANDTDVDGDTLTVAGVDSAALVGGTLGGSGGLYTYTPDPDWYGVETFDYWVTDGAGSTEVATVTVTVTSVNDPVVAADDVATVAEDDTAGVVIDLMANDTDADGDTLTVVSTDTTGIVDGDLDETAGVFTYTPNANFSGTETFDYTVADGNGSTATATATITVTAVPDDPIAAGDAYAIAEDAPLVVAAPGLLDNDGDEDGDPLTVDTTPVAGVSDGSLTLQADGAFSYTPNPGFRGTDTFAYRTGDGTGRFATTLVSITVDSGLSTGAFYLGTGSSGTLPMPSAPLGTTGAEADHDGDGNPGMTLRKGGSGLLMDVLGLLGLGQDDEIAWARTVVGQPLVLNGPVDLRLWSAVSGYQTDKDARPHVLLYDCDGAGSNCTTIAESDQSIDPYNPNPGFGEIPITLGNVSHTVAPGRQLVLRILVQHEDLWIAASGPRPSRIEFTLANAAPVATGDAPAAILEDAATVNVDVIANDTDLNLVASSVSVTVPPSSGTAVARPDGTIDYTPDPDANGPDPFTYQVCDTGGLCDAATVTMAVTAVNDRPTFTVGPDVSSSILSGPYSAPWATAISVGPADETAQTATFTVTAADPLLFLDQPQISPTGVLTFTTIGIVGSTTVDVVMTDDGGSANGGNPTSVTRTFTVTFSP